MLVDSELKERVPSLFNVRPIKGVSEKYDFISTKSIVDVLGGMGWEVSHAEQQQGTKKTQHLKAYKKHLVRFRNEKLSYNQGNYPELVMVNSHDRTSPFKFYMGVFRVACSNGVIIAEANYGGFSFKHMGHDREEVVEHISVIVENVGKNKQLIDRMMKREMKEKEIKEFAERAIELRWNSEKERVEVRDILNIRRKEDDKKDLWTVYNVVQENIIKGGITYVNSMNKSRCARAVKNIGRNVDINIGLYNLAEEYLGD